MAVPSLLRVSAFAGALLTSAALGACSGELGSAAAGGDGGGVDATVTDDAATLDAGALDGEASIGDDGGAADVEAGCTGSAIWTCAADGKSRQRCTSGAVQTEACTFGACIKEPTGKDDLCPPDPSATNASTYCPGGKCVNWWNCKITYQYQYTSSSHDWDTDYHMPDGTPIALAHKSKLSAVYLVGSGFQPEFTDMVTGEWFHINHLHLNSEFGGDDKALGPVQLVSMTDPAHTDHVYPAGWVIGFSGGGTSRTGYLGTDSAGNVCTGGHSTAAHFCVATTSAHPIDFYQPNDGTGCSAPLGWPSALWATLKPLAPGYQTCPSVCTGCGVAHF